jgi:probable F420-dependent oxidoreductase
MNEVVARGEARMQVWAAMSERMGLAEVAAHARRVEAVGYHGLNVPEAVHDGLLLAHAALAATTRLQVATSVLVAFPRSPMVVAQAAWDLQRVSGGRFELGLGSQVRGNIVGRYSTAWSAPVPRMREYVRALRAIFDCWQNGTRLDFEGEHYRFTRMQPFFNPGPLESAPPPIHLGAIGPAMTALAGEVADGLMTHPTNSSPRYLREVVRPRIAHGAARSGRSPAEVSVMAAGLIATGRDVAQVTAARESIREMLSFLYSTPAYWPSLDLYGWREIGECLHTLSREGRWAEMKGAVRDDLLDTLIPTAPYAGIAAVLREGYAGLAERISFPLPDDPADDGEVTKVIAGLA